MSHKKTTIYLKRDESGSDNWTDNYKVSPGVGSRKLRVYAVHGCVWRAGLGRPLVSCRQLSFLSQEKGLFIVLRSQEARLFEAQGQDLSQGRPTVETGWSLQMGNGVRTTTPGVGVLKWTSLSKFNFILAGTKQFLHHQWRDKELQLWNGSQRPLYFAFKKS